MPFDSTCTCTVSVRLFLRGYYPPHKSSFSSYRFGELGKPRQVWHRYRRLRTPEPRSEFSLSLSLSSSFNCYSSERPFYDYDTHSVKSIGFLVVSSLSLSRTLRSAARVASGRRKTPHLISAERPSPQVMVCSCLTSAAAEHGVLEVLAP